MISRASAKRLSIHNRARAVDLQLPPLPDIPVGG